MLHFAYGSNMSVPMMQQRCPTARFIGRAVLAAHRFIITRDGYASVVPAPGCGVHGVLWRIEPRDLVALHAYENLAAGLYRAATMTVSTERCRVAALVYVAQRLGIGRPRPGYLELIITAAREAGLPSDHVRDLARWLRKPLAGARRRP
jgi:gamma-glutamylcyclotransferase (GGCT)/AIG2-like uncharacterized protein YtfP